MIRAWIFMQLYIFRGIIILSAKYYREHHILDILRVGSYFVQFFSRMYKIAYNIVSNRARAGTEVNAFHEARWKKDGELEIGTNRRSVID